MKLSISTFASLTAALLIGVGCQPTRNVTYSVSLKNATDQPVTAWITKTGDRTSDWLAPEDLALQSGTPKLLNDVVIPAGKTGDFGPVSGRFGPDDAAILRVYLGEIDYDTILATSHASPLRVDLALDEGANYLEVRSAGKLELVPVAPAR